MSWQEAFDLGQSIATVAFGVIAGVLAWWAKNEARGARTEARQAKQNSAPLSNGFRTDLDAWRDSVDERLNIEEARLARLETLTRGNSRQITVNTAGIARIEVAVADVLKYVQPCTESREKDETP